MTKSDIFDSHCCLVQGNLIGAGGRPEKAPDFFSSPSIFDMEKCFIPLFGNMGLQYLQAKKYFEKF